MDQHGDCLEHSPGYTEENLQIHMSIYCVISKVSCMFRKLHVVLFINLVQPISKKFPYHSY